MSTFLETLAMVGAWVVVVTALLVVLLTLAVWPPVRRHVGRHHRHAA